MIEFTAIEGKPDAVAFEKIKALYATIFEETDLEKFDRRITAENLLMILAIAEDEIVGFKIGYKISAKKFYSWVGRADRNYRRHGIAAELLKSQNRWCAEKGFENILT